MRGSRFYSLVRRWLGVRKVARTGNEEPVRRAVVEAAVHQPDPNETVELGPVDEVKVDLGPDEAGAGLLERWSEATSSGEPTSAPPANAPLLELPEVTIKAPRSAIPFDRTTPRVDPDPAAKREVTVTEVLSTSPFPWALVLAAIAMGVLALVLALGR
jgi:hypothetical protein